MIEGIEPLYLEIAQSMVDAIPEEWSSARFEAIFFSGSSIYEAEYTRRSDGVVLSFQPTSAGSRALRQLRKKFKEAGKRLWGQARFELRPDGKFNMQWGYENCDDNGDTRFDEEAELQRSEQRRLRLTQS
jgi:hypothetical protein